MKGVSSICTSTCFDGNGSVSRVDAVGGKFLSPPFFRRKGFAISEHFIEFNQQSIKQSRPFDDGFDHPMEKGVRFIPGANRKADSATSSRRLSVSPASRPLAVPGLMAWIDPLSRSFKTGFPVFADRIHGTSLDTSVTDLAERFDSKFLRLIQFQRQIRDDFEVI